MRNRYLEYQVFETDCENGRWVELVLDRVQWQGLLSAPLNIRVWHQRFSYPWRFSGL